MLIAKEKAKNNIGEYLIYMYQIEDLIRACKFEKEIIKNNLVSQYATDADTLKEIEDWYFGLSDLMEEEKITSEGHLGFINNKINELNEFHLFLLQSTEHDDYKKQYKETEAILQEFASKQKEQINNAVKLLIDAIYSYYLLKLKKESITKETINAITLFSLLLNTLSAKFKAYEKGEMKIFED